MTHIYLQVSVTLSNFLTPPPLLNINYPEYTLTTPAFGYISIMSYVQWLFEGLDYDQNKPVSLISYHPYVLLFYEN